MFPAKPGHLVIITMELGCILRKHSVEISYSYNCRITAVVAHTVRDESESSSAHTRLKKGVYVLIGFDDGCAALYFLMETSNYSLMQVFKVTPKLGKKQPVINIKVSNLDLILICAYSVWVYYDIFKK